MKQKFKPFLSIGEAISRLLYPTAEVVIHDLKSGKIAAIFNPLSKREVGDDSLISDAEFPEIFDPYFKSNWDGSQMKSITALIYDEKGKSIGLFCINLAIAPWQEMQQLLEQLLGAKPAPDLLFKDDWQEKINRYVGNFLREKQLNLKTLPKERMEELVAALYHEGAFAAKNAAAYIASTLKVSRATIYKYLKDIR